jgi:hypothetical protein
VADFGFQPLLEIGDFVWRDSNGNGVQDAGEPGLANVVVQLSGPGVVSAQTLTDMNGFYRFARSDLPALSASAPYKITVALGQGPLAGLQPTFDGLSAPGAPLDAARDSDGVWDRNGETSTASSALTPAFGSRIQTYDFGFVAELSLGGDLWEDTNGDGANDAAETRLAGILVELFTTSGTPVGTTLSLADGSYLFRSSETAATMLPNTTFEVRVKYPQALLSNVNGVLLPTTSNVAAAGDARDSDAAFDATNNAAVIVGARTGDFGSTNTTNDFGFVGPLVIGDFVWRDANGNGAQDSVAAEPGIAGVTVDLLRNGTTVERAPTTERRRASTCSTSATTARSAAQRRLHWCASIARRRRPSSPIATLHLTTPNAAAVSDAARL